MLCLAFGKTCRTEDQNNIRRSLTENVHVNKQVSLLAAAARTAEVSGLRQDLERIEGELILAKRQLEENQGT